MAGYTNPPQSQVPPLKGRNDAQVLSLCAVRARLPEPRLSPASVKPLRACAGAKAAAASGRPPRPLLPGMCPLACAHACWQQGGCGGLPRYFVAFLSDCARPCDPNTEQLGLGQRWRATRGQTGHLMVQRLGHLVGHPRCPGASKRARPRAAKPRAAGAAGVGAASAASGSYFSRTQKDNC